MGTMGKIIVTKDDTEIQDSKLYIRNETEVWVVTETSEFKTDLSFDPDKGSINQLIDFDGNSLSVISAENFQVEEDSNKEIVLSEGITAKLDCNEQGTVTSYKVGPVSQPSTYASYSSSSASSLSSDLSSNDAEQNQGSHDLRVEQPSSSSSASSLLSGFFSHGVKQDQDSHELTVEQPSSSSSSSSLLSRLLSHGVKQDQVSHELPVVQPSSSSSSSSSDLSSNGTEPSQDRSELNEQDKQIQELKEVLDIREKDLDAVFGDHPFGKRARRMLEDARGILSNFDKNQSSFEEIINQVQTYRAELTSEIQQAEPFYYLRQDYASLLAARDVEKKNPSSNEQKSKIKALNGRLNELGLALGLIVNPNIFQDCEQGTIEAELARLHGNIDKLSGEKPRGTKTPASENWILKQAFNTMYKKLYAAYFQLNNELTAYNFVDVINKINQVDLTDLSNYKEVKQLLSKQEPSERNPKILTVKYPYQNTLLADLQKSLDSLSNQANHVKTAFINFHELISIPTDPSDPYYDYMLDIAEADDLLVRAEKFFNVVRTIQEDYSSSNNDLAKALAKITEQAASHLNAIKALVNDELKSEDGLSNTHSIAYKQAEHAKQAQEASQHQSLITKWIKTGLSSVFSSAQSTQKPFVRLSSVTTHDQYEFLSTFIEQLNDISVPTSTMEETWFAAISAKERETNPERIDYDRTVKRLIDDLTAIKDKAASSIDEKLLPSDFMSSAHAVISYHLQHNQSKQYGPAVANALIAAIRKSPQYNLYAETARLNTFGVSIEKEEEEGEREAINMNDKSSFVVNNPSSYENLSAYLKAVHRTYSEFASNALLANHYNDLLDVREALKASSSSSSSSRSFA